MGSKFANLEATEPTVLSLAEKRGGMTQEFILEVKRLFVVLLLAWMDFTIRRARSQLLPGSKNPYSTSEESCIHLTMPVHTLTALCWGGSFPFQPQVS